MRLATILTLACGVTAGSSTSLSSAEVSRCGVTQESEDLRAMAYNLSIQEKHQLLQDREVTSIIVPTIVHVVYANESEQGGYIPVSVI